MASIKVYHNGTWEKSGGGTKIYENRTVATATVNTGWTTLYTQTIPKGNYIVYGQLSFNNTAAIANVGLVIGRQDQTNPPQDQVLARQVTSLAGANTGAGLNAMCILTEASFTQPTLTLGLYCYMGQSVTRTSCSLVCVKID